MPRNVFVSGCFGMLHSGHVAFFETAAEYGDLHVAIGSDKTVLDLKGRPTVNSEGERLFMVRSIACVTSASISSGSGILDFEPELRDIPEKQMLCEELGIEYMALDRTSDGGLIPARRPSSARST